MVLDVPLRMLSSPVARGRHPASQYLLLTLCTVNGARCTVKDAGHAPDIGLLWTATLWPCASPPNESRYMLSAIWMFEKSKNLQSVALPPNHTSALSRLDINLESNIDISLDFYLDFIVDFKLDFNLYFKLDFNLNFTIDINLDFKLDFNLDLKVDFDIDFKVDLNIDFNLHRNLELMYQ